MKIKERIQVKYRYEDGQLLVTLKLQKQKLGHKKFWKFTRLCLIRAVIQVLSLICA